MRQPIPDLGADTNRGIINNNHSPARENVVDANVEGVVSDNPERMGKPMDGSTFEVAFSTHTVASSNFALLSSFFHILEILRFSQKFDPTL